MAPLDKLITPAAAMMWIATRDEEQVAPFYRNATNDRAMWFKLVVELQDLREHGKLKQNEAELLSLAPEWEAFCRIDDEASKLGFEDSNKAIENIGLVEGETIRKLGYVKKSSTVKVYQKMVRKGLSLGWRAIRVPDLEIVSPASWATHMPFAYDAAVETALGRNQCSVFEFLISSEDVCLHYPPSQVEIKNLELKGEDAVFKAAAALMNSKLRPQRGRGRLTAVVKLLEPRTQHKFSSIERWARGAVRKWENDHPEG